MSEGAGDGSAGATGLTPGALTALLQEVAAAPEKREEEALSVPPGTLIGRFEIIRELGRGGFGVVYEGRDRDLGRQVAVKVVRPGRITEEEGKVSGEAEAIARLSHPNLITLFEVGRSEHGPFLVFELLRGKTLDLKIEEGPLPVQEAVHVATEVARGLAHAHAEGVIHRDLKPANVFVTNKGQVKILDFGMAHAFGRRRLSGGTPAYMAPEQWEDAPEDERTDVFALGVMLYRMLTGEYPFPEREGRWSAEPGVPRKLDVPGAPDLAELVERMLDPIPTRRPRDGAAVLAELTPIEDRLRARPADGKAPEHAKRRKATFGDLLSELKRRHVFRVMVGYGIFAFAVLQVTEPIMHGADLPDWVLKAVLVALALGFPVAVILAWVYDLTAQGVKRTPSASGPGGPVSGRARLLLPLALSAAVLVLAAVGAGAWYAWKRTAEHRQDLGMAGVSPSVAVLSFADLSPGHDQEHLSDGVAEEVLNGLSQVDGLRVIGRSTAFSYKGKGKKVEEIGRELGVGSVLEGSVRRSGDKIRITVQLVRARDAATLWSRSFERSLSDVFAVQDEIGRAVVEALAVRLVPGRTLARSGGSSDPEAIQLYLKGRDQSRRGGPELPGALRSFEQAVKVDPRFALAWVGISDAIVTIEATGEMPDDPTARRRRAHEAADVAVGLAPGLADAFRARADVRQWLEADWRGQREDVERARALAPGDSAVTLSGAFSLLVHGRTDEAIAEFERVTRIDPLLERGWVSGWLGLYAAAYSRRDHEKARQAADRMAELFPGYRAFALVGIAMDRVVAGEAREALAIADEFRAMVPPQGAWALFVEALAYHDLGRPADAAGAREALARLGDRGSYQMAQTYARAGEADRAFDWLEKARTFPDTAMFWLKTDPLLDPIRRDARWPELLVRAGLPPDGAGEGASALATGSPAPSIAVLPFADMSPKHDQEYFADGVAEEIRNALAHVEGLKVIGRSSSFSFKGKPDDLKAIGQKLGVANVLEGSLRKDGNDIRVTAQLIRVADGSHLWSESYDRKLAGVLKVQDEIARAVVGALKVKLLPGATVPPVSRRRLDPAAHEQFLLGRDYLRRGWKEANFRLAVHAFESALGIDPGYAQAWAGLSRALLVLGDFAKSPAEFAESQRKMMAAAEKAIAIDPDLPDGYLARAGGRRGRAWEFAGAKADVERALQINPGDASASRELGEVLFSLGRARESVAVLQKASDLDPLDGVTWLSLGYAYLALGDLASARAAADRARKINPDDSWVWFLSGTISLLEGDPAAALAAAERSSDETFRVMGVALARKELGQEAKAREALADLTTRFAATGAFQIAQVHAWWGERDAAFEWLERAYRQSDAGLIIVKLDPLLRSLRGDPRWKPFLRKLNLPVD